MPLFRYDVAPLAKPRVLPNGSLAVDAHLTRTGIFEYRNPDGSTRRELRLPDEVFHPDALASLALIPVTNDHPPSNEDGTPQTISPVNARQFAVGTVGESVRRDGEFVRAPLVIYDADTIAAIQAGKRQLSVGYHLDLDETPGQWRGEHYDAVQRNIRGNHLAIVDRGRAGPGAAIRIDTQDRKETEHMEITINGIRYTVDEAVGKRLSDLETQAKSLAADVETVTARADQAAAELTKLAPERDAEKARADAAEAQLKALTTERDQAKARADAALEAAAPEKLQAAVKARVALETAAKAHLPADFALDSLTDRQVKEAVVKHASPKAELDKASDDYVNARFDAVLEQPSDAVLGARAAAVHADGPMTEEKRREAMMKANREAFQPATQKGN